MRELYKDLSYSQFYVVNPSMREGEEEMLSEYVSRINEEYAVEIAKNRCWCPLFSLSLLQVMLLKLNVVEDISYPQQNRQSGSKALEQIAGMGGQG